MGVDSPTNPCQMAKISNKNINYMFSKSKALFSSLGILALLLMGYFWLATTALGFSALENFAIILSNTRFFGYYIPEIIGFERYDSTGVQVMGVKLAITALTFIFSILLIYTSFLESLKDQIRFLNNSLGWVILAIALLVTSVVVYDDHPMINSDKLQLFVFIACCMIIVPLLFSLGKIRKSTKKSDSSLNVVQNHLKAEESKSELSDLETSDGKAIEEQSEDEIDDHDEALSTSADAEDAKESLPVGQEKNPDENKDNSEDFSDEEEADSSNDVDFNEKDSGDQLADVGPSTKMLPPPSSADLPADLMKLREESDDSAEEKPNDSAEEKP